MIDSRLSYLQARIDAAQARRDAEARQRAAAAIAHRRSLREPQASESPAAPRAGPPRRGLPPIHHRLIQPCCGRPRA